MIKNKHIKSLAVISPPIILVIIGLGIYIFVTKLIAPELKTISAIPNDQQSAQSSTSTTPNSTDSAKTANPISTEVAMPSDAELNQLQAEADKGEHTSMLDPVSAAEQQAGNYGFIPGDQLTLVVNESSQAPSKVATILAVHYGDAYILTMVQPKKIGTGGIWIIQSIEKQS